LFEVVRDARVLDRGRKGDNDGVLPGLPRGDVVGGSEKAGCDGDRLLDTSEAQESDRPEIGTVRV
jgi:hypothetical protein